MISLLLKAEPFWHKCHPCKNNGNCCVNSETMATAAEWEIIVKQLSELSREDFQIIRNNVDCGQNCAFRSPNKCLIHDVRPLVCRVTPYYAFRMNDTFAFLHPIGSCSEEERHKGYVPVTQLDSTNRFFRVRPPNSEANIHYLNGDLLLEHPIFKKIRKGKKFVPQWLTEYFASEK